MLAFFYTCIFVVGAWATPFVYHHHLVHGGVVGSLVIVAANIIGSSSCSERFLLRRWRRGGGGGSTTRVVLVPAPVPDRPRRSPACSTGPSSGARIPSWTPSCRNQTGFGFWIGWDDGVVTLPPTLLLSYTATWNIPWLSARAIGVVGIIFNYQMLYGTVLYFCNYCWRIYASEDGPADVG